MQWQPHLTVKEIWAKSFVLLAICSIAVLNVLALQGLYADGSYFLLSILSDRWFFEGDQARLLAGFLTQIPVLTAMAAGVTNVNSLMYWHSVGVCALPAVIWIVAMLKSWKTDYFWPVVVIFSVVYLNSSFFAVGEYNLCYSLVAYSAVVLLQRGYLSWCDSCSLLLAAVALIASYPSMIFLGPLLIFISLSRLTQTEKLKTFEGASISFATLCYASATLIGGWSVASPSAPPNLARATSISGLLDNFQLCLAFLLSFCYFANRRTRNSKVRVLVDALLGIVATIFLVYGSWPYQHYGSRVFVGLMLLVLVGSLAIERIGYNKAIPISNAHSSWIFPLVLFLGLSLTYVQHLFGFSAFINKFADEVNSRRGLVEFEDTSLDNWSARIYGWGWTYPVLSILFREGSNRAIILNPAGYRGWMPFDPNSTVPAIGAFKRPGRPSALTANFFEPD